MASYYHARTVPLPIDEAEAKVTEALKAEGFGVLTRIDVAATLLEKIGVEMHPYRILGACNPQFAHQALTAENKIGTMLPCNVIVQAVGEGQTEVAAVDPVASMAAIPNPDLSELAGVVRDRLRRVVDGL